MVKEEVKLYDYQYTATEFVLNNIGETNVLLAAAPNAGKTFMASFIIKELIKNGNRVLCSVHGTNVLKRQFYDSICSIVGVNDVSIYDTSNTSLYDPNKSVQIMIYQNTRQMSECVELFGKFDYLVVDEAHKFYDGTTSMETICDEYVSGNHLLLTGSPAVFKGKVDSGEIRAKYISAGLIESMHSGQYDSEIKLDVVSNDIHLTIEDYNADGEVIEKSRNKLTNNEVVLDSLLIDDFGKVIIFVKTILQANRIETYLNGKDILNYTSHSQSDKDSELITVFKNDFSGVDNVVLIVVGRATEGFDDSNVSIIDITYTKNIDTLYQRYSRAIRKRTNAVNKRYVKVIPNNDNSAEVFIHIMTAVLMLLKQEHYKNFNGKNFSLPTLKQIVKKTKCGVGLVKSFVPKPKHETNDIKDNNITIKSSDEPQSVRDLVDNKDFIVNLTIGDDVYEIKSEDYNEWVDRLGGKEYLISVEKSNDKVDDCLLMESQLYSGSFFDMKNELYGYITRYATSNLSDVLMEINGDAYATAEQHIDFIKQNNIAGNIKYGKSYKNCELKLHSNPWVKYGNGSSKDYFESIWGVLATAEQHVDFIKLNNITSNNKYKKSYKNSELKLHSNPWRKYGNGSSTDYFESIWGKTYSTAEQHIDFIKQNNIASGVKYFKQYKDCEFNLHSNPWIKYGNGSQKDYFESIWGGLATAEQHIDFIKQNNITSRRKYYKQYKDCELSLHSNPWSNTMYGNGSVKDYFESIWGETYATAEQHIDFIKQNNITGNKKYAKSYKNCEFNLHSQPWIKYGNGCIKDYFKSICGEHATAEQHIDFIKQNNITGNIKYGKSYKNSELRLYSQPWVKYGNGNVKDYFESIWGVLATAEQHIGFIKQNNINSNNKYAKSYKNCELKLHSNPWIKYGNGSIKDYFESIWGEIGTYATAEQHIDFIKQNNITGNIKYTKSYKNCELRLYFKPWIKYGNGSIKDYFESIWGVLATAEQHIDFIKQNNITGSSEYYKQYKDSELSLHSNPWRKYGNGSIKDYFESILGTKEERKEREYRECCLGEFSEMNKTWSTSNSNNLHNKLKSDPTEWKEYHKLYSLLRENWVEIPAETIASKINDTSLLVADLGCGEKLLSKALPNNKVLCFDHIAYDDEVVSCDVSDLPLEDNKVDVVVLSLALMGSNDSEYLDTAYRILKDGGKLYIAEPQSKGERNVGVLIPKLKEIGFSLLDMDIRNNLMFIDLVK